MFVSPEADVPGIVSGAARAWPDARIAGCTTAGEISGAGYEDGSIVAIGFRARHFAAQTLLIPDLSQLAASELSEALLHVRQSLARDHGHLPEEFALLFVDGLSAREDELASVLAAGTGAMPLIGGSAGDGTNFRETLVFDGRRLLANAAVISVMRGACPLRAFKMDHIRPTERRMVVTEADPAARIVRKINAEPAVQEYARLIGMQPESVDTLTFAIHPLTVRMGERHHVRAIQRVLPSGELLFFSAIDEGMVLTIAEPHDLVDHLAGELQALKQPGNPVAVLAFDCILRRVEAQEKQMTGRVSELLRHHGVIGFSTYGEQIGPMHINHTMTGFAFYPPGTILSGSDP
nr:FIST N-terminal domain-containing protein [Shinella kummerowiae]